MPNQAKDDVYKKPVAQPAVVKYKVQKDDTYVSLGGQSVIAANPGVPQLSTGQVINLPNPNAAFPVTNNPYLNGPNVHTQVPVMGQQPQTVGGSFMSGNGNVNMTGPRNGFQTPTTNGFMAPQLTTGSFYSGSGEVNLTGVTAGGGSGSTGGGNVPQRPQGVYTGGNSANDVAWRNYWNYSAANPTTVQNPVSTYMPTRNDIWERKAAQRRRQAESQDYTSQNYTGYAPQTGFTPMGNNVVGGSWRVG